VLAQDLGRKWAMYDTVRWPLASVPLDQPFHDSQRRQAVPPQQEKVVVRLWRLDAEHLGPHPAPRTTPRQLPARRGSSAYGLQSHLAHTLSAVPLMCFHKRSRTTEPDAACWPRRPHAVAAAAGGAAGPGPRGSGPSQARGAFPGSPAPAGQRVRSSSLHAVVGAPGGALTPAACAQI